MFRIFTFVTAAAITVSAIPAHAQTLEVSGPVREFIAAAGDYAAMHRRIERSQPPLEISAAPDSIVLAIESMASAIRTARAGAGQGALFTPELAGELRARISQSLLAHAITAEEVRESARTDGIDPGLAVLRVNGSFPWRFASAVLPCVIQALPPLPPELQYRFVDDQLVLVDVHASLIVDILPSALTDARPR
jgi:hypothetical protein